MFNWEDEMFCDRCGTQLAGNATFCASCGKQVNPLPAPRYRAGRVESHIRMLGYFWLAYSILRLLGGWLFAAFLTHWSTVWNPYPPFPFFHAGLLRAIGGLLMACGVLGIVAGWGLLERRPWARTLAIVLGFLVLFHFGIGTVLGIYTLWVLLPAGSAQEYQRTARLV